MRGNVFGHRVSGAVERTYSGVCHDTPLTVTPLEYHWSMFECSVSLPELRGLQTVLSSMVSTLNPELVALPDALELWETFAGVERLAKAAKTVLARRVEESNAWRRSGCRSAEEWMARKEGSTVGSAKDALDTSRRLKDLTDTESAFKAGRLSGEQAGAISDAAAVNPQAEKELLDQSRRGSLKDLRDECRNAKHAADPDPDESHRRRRKARRAHSWTDDEGCWNLRARGTVDDGARFEAVWKATIDELFNADRAGGDASTNTDDERRTYQQRAFDALVELAERAASDGGGHGTKVRTRHRALIRVDLEALTRGRIEGDEVCEIAGLGAIPVGLARRLLGDSVLHLVLTKGTDVANLTYLGRGPSAVQKLAVLWFQNCCQNEACNATFTEHDHRVEFAVSRHTRADELDRLCGHDHDLKTRHGWALVPGVGRRALVPSDDPRHPNNQPRAGP